MGKDFLLRPENNHPFFLYNFAWILLLLVVYVPIKVYFINVDCHLQIILVCEYQSFLKILKRYSIKIYKKPPLKSAKLKFLLLGFFQDKNDIITPQEYALLERVLENWIWPFFLTFFLLGSIHPHY